MIKNLSFFEKTSNAEKIYSHFFIFLCLFSSLEGAASLSDPLAQANQLYQTGLTSNEVPIKEKVFNQALALYLDVEHQLSPSADAGLLNYNIGNTYTQLHLYPMAALYYYRALKTDPHNIHIHDNLNFIRSKLHIEPQENGAVIFYPVTIMLFSAFSILLFVLFSLYIWTRNSFWISVSWLPALVIISLFAVGIYQYTFEPVDAVVIEPSSIYKSPNTHALYASEAPLIPGTKIRVLSSTSNGEWLKVTTENGVVGFINYEHLRII